MKVALEATAEETNGLWVDYQGAQLLIARGGNSKFLRTVDRLEQPYARKRSRGKQIPTETEIELSCKAMAEAILLGWKGIETGDGPLEYSTEAAYLVLRHNVALREFVHEFATNEENYRQEAIEETAKKSPSGPTGEPPTDKT